MYGTPYYHLLPLINANQPHCRKNINEDFVIQFKAAYVVHFSSFTAKPGSRDYFSFSAFSLFVMTQGVKVSAASKFQLHIILIFLDLDRPGVLASGHEQEVLDFLNFAGHSDKQGARLQRQGTRSKDSLGHAS